MKKPLLISLVFAASVASAQGNSYSGRSQVQRRAPEQNSSRGFRIAFVKPLLSYDYSETYTTRRGRIIPLDSDDGFNGTSKGALEGSGLSLGYASLPEGGLGWTTDLTLMELKQSKVAAQLGRLGMNLAYAFNGLFSLRGGVNMSKFTGGTVFSSLKSSMGNQFGMGAQFTRNLGLDLVYTQMDHSGKYEDIDVTSKKSGLELSLHGTF